MITPGRGSSTRRLRALGGRGTSTTSSTGSGLEAGRTRSQVGEGRPRVPCEEACARPSGYVSDPGDQPGSGAPSGSPRRSTGARRTRSSSGPASSGIESQELEFLVPLHSQHVTIGRSEKVVRGPPDQIDDVRGDDPLKVFTACQAHGEQAVSRARVRARRLAQGVRQPGADGVPDQGRAGRRPARSPGRAVRAQQGAGRDQGCRGHRRLETAGCTLHNKSVVQQLREMLAEPRAAARRADAAPVPAGRSASYCTRTRTSPSADKDGRTHLSAAAVRRPQVAALGRGRLRGSVQHRAIWTSSSRRPASTRLPPASLRWIRVRPTNPSRRPPEQLPKASTAGPG